MSHYPTGAPVPFGPGTPLPPHMQVPPGISPDDPRLMALLAQQGQMRAAPPTQVQQQMDPREFVAGLSEEDLYEFHDAIIDAYRKQHPDLGEFELYIAAEVSEVLEEARRRGVRIPQTKAIEEGIARFRKKFNKAAQAEQKQLAQRSHEHPEDLERARQAGNKQVNRMALDMDLGGSPEQFRKMSPEDIWNMPREKFLEMDRKIRSRHYR